MPTLQNLIRQIRDSSRADWEHVTAAQGAEPLDAWIYKSDVQLRIEAREAKEDAERKLTAAWTKNFAGGDAYASDYTVYYGASPLLSVLLAAVDSRRGVVPLPRKAGDSQVEPLHYKLAEIVNMSETRFLDCMNKAGLKLAGGSSTSVG